MSDDPNVHYYYRYCPIGPPGVKDIIAGGTCAWIGDVDESTVLKFPLSPDPEWEHKSRFETERKLYEVVGPHPRIIGLRGHTDDGILLERAVKGSLLDYILNAKTPPSIQQRLSWCREAAEAVAYIHSKRVLHCDIQPGNLLLDDKLHIKLSDFQGRLLASDDKEILLDGWSGEPCRFRCPREDPFNADYKTDMFALGCNIYFIMMGHAVYPDIIDGEDRWYLKVDERFEKGLFPDDNHVCSHITYKCFRLQYDSANEIVRDIVAIEERLAAAGDQQQDNFDKSV